MTCWHSSKFGWKLSSNKIQRMAKLINNYLHNSMIWRSVAAEPPPSPYHIEFTRTEFIASRFLLILNCNHDEQVKLVLIVWQDDQSSTTKIETIIACCCRTAPRYTPTNESFPSQKLIWYWLFMLIEKIHKWTISMQPTNRTDRPTNWPATKWLWGKWLNTASSQFECCALN